MKKRILALALCLVMAVSLLPITAAAVDFYDLNNVYVTSSGFEKTADGYVLKEDTWLIDNVDPSIDGLFKTNSLPLCQDAAVTVPVTDDPAGGGTYYLKCQIRFDETYVVQNNLNADNCSLVIPGYSSAYVRSNLNKTENGCYVDIIFQVTKTHEHCWTYEKTADNNLTVICENSGCPIGKVGVTIDAHSVTLPDSPFNAQLKLEGDAKEVFSYGDIEYKYEDPGTGWEEVDPDTFTPKAGRYQAGILIYGLPANGGVAARAVGNEDGFGQGEASVYLFVKYNAVDPAVTAQTGDNRPIELMMISAAVFSALAAAAFILDHKRRNASL